MKPRVLIIAEAANPEWVSVPLIGWYHSQALRAVADTHLVTQIRNREALLRAGLVEGADFTAIDSEWIERPAVKFASILRGDEGKGWTTLQAFQSLTYPLFERQVWRQFREDIEGGVYDIVHRITPMSPTSQSPIAAKCARSGVPFVLGPINGGLPWPEGFDAERRKEREWLSYFRSIYKMMPHRRATLKAASAIIVGSKATEADIPPEFLEKCVYISESAVDPARFSLPVKPDISSPLRACFIGRMVPYKGPDILLRAAAPFLRDGRLRLDLIGDGPMMPELSQIIAQEGIDHAVSRPGWIPHAKLQDTAIKSDIFAFPSVREFGGTSILEMMAIGLVPVIADYGGPGENVVDGVGFKIPVESREALTQGMHKALADILDAPDELLTYRARGQAWIQSKFTWLRRAEQVREVYDWVLGKRPERPAPFGPDAAAEVFAALPERKTAGNVPPVS